MVGGFQASRVNTEKIIEYRNARMESGAGPATVNKELAIFRAMFYHAFEDYTPAKIQRVPKFPAKLKEPTPRQGFVNDEQYDALQENCREPWLKAFLALAYNDGFRKGELVGNSQRKHQPGIYVHQVNLTDRTVRLFRGTTKNDEGRVVRMTDEVFALVKPCLDGKRREDPLFTWSNTGSKVKDFRGAWKRLVRAAGVTVSITPHDFRRSAARNMIDAGIDRDVCKSITGHITDSMFSRYNIVDAQRMSDAAAKIAARRNGRQTVTAVEREGR